MFRNGLIAVLLFLTGCGLVPSFKSHSMSNAEKAALNVQLGTRYLEMGMLDVAQEKLETALRLDSNSPDAHNAMAIFYERIRNVDAAINHYESAIQHNPNDFNSQSNYGRLLCEHGDSSKGMQVLQQAIDAPLNNKQWFALTSMGICYIKQNDSKRGENLLRQALQLQPDHPPALQEMQKLSYNNRQYLSARGFLERYLAVAKHTPETLSTAFQTERALGNSKAADAFADELLAQFPLSKEAQLIKTATGR